MKKLTIFAMAALVCMSCAAKKPIKQAEPQKTATELEIERLKQEKELRDLKEQMRQDSIKRARQEQLDQLQFENELAQKESQAAMNATLESGVKLRITPCMDEFIALNKVPDYMAGQGISSANDSREEAELRANEVGLNDIKTRFLGVIKNGTEYYSKQNNTYGNNKAKESQLENIAISAGEKAINKLYSVDCRQFAQDKYGQWICYEAIFVPMKKVVDSIMEEVKELDIDKELYRKRLEAELESNAAKENAALDLQQQQISR